ncbi:unnamed protein product [Coregonus sp. 'balchen']|nr:unnamed protein product [Coregonus sp. 'balchen']
MRGFNYLARVTPRWEEFAPVLYVAYTSVSDLSQASMLENLQLLDLEGNAVDDLVQVQYLGLCSQLRTLTLKGNPVCMRPHPNTTQSEEEEGYSYWLAVRELVPQLQYLDDIPSSADADPASVDPDASVLTHGAGKVLFCGNPVQAIRARQQKMRTAAPSPVSTPRAPPLYVLEHMYDLLEQDGRQRSDVFSEGGEEPGESLSPLVYKVIKHVKPNHATSAPGGRRLSELRARRLRLSGGVAEAGAGTAVKPTKDHTELGPIRRDPGFEEPRAPGGYEAQSPSASQGYSAHAPQSSPWSEGSGHRQAELLCSRAKGIN